MATTDMYDAAYSAFISSRTESIERFTKAHGHEMKVATRDAVDRAIAASPSDEQSDKLRSALRGMMIFYGMDEDKDNGACVAVWDAAREAME